MGSSGVPVSDDQKYSDTNRSKKQKYKVGSNPDRIKGGYHKKSESMPQAKMKQLINKKEISFQKITETQQNTPYSAKYNKQDFIESKGHHAHHHSVAVNSPQCNNIVSSSTGSTKELKTVSNRVPKSSKSKSKVNIGKPKASPVLISKSSMHGHMGEKMSMTEPSNMGHITPNIKYSYSKADTISSYAKPTYIILTIDNSGEKGYIKKKEAPKSSLHSIASSSYAKQGQSYQQLSNLKSELKYDS